MLAKWTFFPFLIGKMSSSLKGWYGSCGGSTHALVIWQRGQGFLFSLGSLFIYLAEMSKKEVGNPRNQRLIGPSPLHGIAKVSETYTFASLFIVLPLQEPRSRIRNSVCIFYKNWDLVELTRIFLEANSFNKNAWLSFHPLCREGLFCENAQEAILYVIIFTPAFYVHTFTLSRSKVGQNGSFLLYSSHKENMESTSDQFVNSIVLQYGPG